MAGFSDLKAVFINTTLTSTAQGESHTERLMRNGMAIMETNGVQVDLLRAADHHIAYGVQPTCANMAPIGTTGRRFSGRKSATPTFW